ncbi:MAG: oligosaccharide flippase family protein [Candidatus Omnitrophica bacterium]|nr:oligosaccharide flippase family protein [Candidatus Omnitrophota bacterium]
MKSNFKNSLYGSVGFILPLVITLITTPYIIKKLTPEVYGLYILAISLMGLLSFLDLGFGQGIIKFISEYEAKNDRKAIQDVIGISFFVYLIMGIIGSVIIFLSTDYLVELFKVEDKYKELAKQAFYIASFGFFLNFITNVFSPIPNALQRYDIAAKVQVSIYLVLNLLIIILLYSGYGLKEVMIANIALAIIKLVVYFSLYRWLLPDIPFKPYFKVDVFKKIFSFSFFTAVNSITGNIVYRLDKMIISSFLGTSAVTYYTLPFMIIQACQGLIASANNFLFPASSGLASLGQNEKLANLYKKVFAYVVAVSIIITTGAIVLLEEFISLWIGQDFARNTKDIIPILAITFFFHFISIPAFYIYNGLGFSLINMVSSIVGASAYLVSALLFIPLFGLIGAALSFAFTLIPFPFYFYYFHKIVDVDYTFLYRLLFKSLLSIILVNVLIALIKYIFNLDISMVSFIIIFVISVLLSLIIIFLNKILLPSEVVILLKRAKGDLI